MNSQPPIILFDGMCNLCSGSVQFVLKRDPGSRFRFASLQGKAGQEILRKFQLPVTDFNSFLLVEGDRLYTKSTGALRVARKLGGAWPVLYVLILVPRFIRDGAYSWIAKNRYRWFGKKETCWLPSPKWENRFLDD